MKSIIVWDVTPCSLIDAYEYQAGNYVKFRQILLLSGLYNMSLPISIASAVPNPHHLPTTLVPSLLLRGPYTYGLSPLSCQICTSGHSED
jgi:hypothetical protein